MLIKHVGFLRKRRPTVATENRNESIVGVPVLLKDGLFRHGTAAHHGLWMDLFLWRTGINQLVDVCGEFDVGATVLLT